ncbi:MAG: hypothetical protein IKD08_00465 [Alphaproteobacteria bacterium]|nr:hypothetical protein [Alphaproteobacteria bacterium]
MVKICTENTEWNKNIHTIRAINRPYIPVQRNSQKAVDEIIANLSNPKYDVVQALKDSGNLSHLPLLVVIGRNENVSKEAFIKVLSAAYNRGVDITALGRISLATNRDEAFNYCASLDRNAMVSATEKLSLRVISSDNLTAPEAWVSDVPKEGSASLLKALRLALQNDIPGIKEVLSGLPKTVAACVKASGEVKTPLSQPFGRVIKYRV